MLLDAVLGFVCSNSRIFNLLALSVFSGTD